MADRIMVCVLYWLGYILMLAMAVDGDRGAFTTGRLTNHMLIAALAWPVLVVWAFVDIAIDRLRRRNVSAR